MLIQKNKDKCAVLHSIYHENPNIAIFITFLGCPDIKLVLQIKIVLKEE